MSHLVAIVLLAAGASTRMRGRDKLLAEIDGTPLVLRQTRAACRACDDVTVVLPQGDHARGAWLSDSAARVVRVVDRAMSASIAAGVAGCQADAVMIALADMPEVEAADFERLIAASQNHPDQIIQATSADGRPGQPVVFPRALFPKLSKLTGDTGAKAVIAEHGARPCPLPGNRALVDLDTPEDWAAWRARR